MIFLLDYDRLLGELAHVEVFDDADRGSAEDRRLKTELRQLRTGIRREVVLLQATSEQALRKTHRRYFADIAALASADSRAS
jgi:hypothetical protein